MASASARRSDGNDMVKVVGMMVEEGKSQSSRILQGSAGEADGGVEGAAAAASDDDDDDDDDDDALLGVAGASSESGWV